MEISILMGQKLTNSKYKGKKSKADSDSKTGISVFPNPANNEITIAGENMSDVRIYDELGKLLMSRKPISNSQKIYIGDIAQSVILVEVTQNDGSISKHKVVILH